MTLLATMFVALCICLALGLMLADTMIKFTESMYEKIRAKIKQVRNE